MCGRINWPSGGSCPFDLIALLCLRAFWLFLGFLFVSITRRLPFFAFTDETAPSGSVRLDAARSNVYTLCLERIHMGRKLAHGVYTVHVDYHR